MTRYTAEPMFKKEFAYNEAKHGCGYWALCVERTKGKPCPCSLPASGFAQYDYDTYKMLWKTRASR